MFEQELTPAEQKVLDIFLKSKNSGEVKNRIARYVQSALNEGNALQPRMLGEALTKEQILDLEALHQEQIELYQTMKELDAVSEEYTADTININGKERPVFNSEGNRIAKSEKALRAFYKWFGDSKVVDSKGRPRVMYHGTNASFDTFDIEKFGKTDSGHYGKGFYFEMRRAFAKSYGKKVMKVYLKANNIFNADNVNLLEYLKETNFITQKKYKQLLKDSRLILDMPIKDRVFASKAVKDKEKRALAEYRALFSEALKEQGYDGIQHYTEFVAFSPNQIKSVDNRGTFDLNDNNIYHQSAAYYPNKVVIDEGVVDLTDAFDSVPTIKEVEDFVKEITEKGKEFLTLSKDWIVKAPKGAYRKRHIVYSDKWEKMSSAQKERHSKFVIALKEILENSIYLDWAPNKKTDKPQKKNVKKYHYFGSTVKIGNKIYDIIFDTEQFKDDSIDKPRKVSLYNVYEKNESPFGSSTLASKYPIGDSVDTISQSDENVNSDGKLYQKGYVSMKGELVGDYLDADGFEGTGEGAMAHGWGNYLLKDRKTNKVRYFDKWNERKIFYQGKEVGFKGMEALMAYYLDKQQDDGLSNDEIIALVNEDMQRYKGYIKEEKEKIKKDETEYSLDKNLLEDIKEYAKNDGNVSYEIRERIYNNLTNRAIYTDWYRSYKNYLKFTKYLEEFKKMKNLDFSKIEIKNSAAQYEAEVPEDKFLLDENKFFNKQSKVVRDAINEIAQEMGNRFNEAKLRKLTNDKYPGSGSENWKTYYGKRAFFLGKQRALEYIHNDQEGTLEQELTDFINNLDFNDISDPRDFNDYTGKEIYQELDNYYGSQKRVSKLLEKHGIKGIKYDGRSDGIGYVIFKGADVPITRRLLQSQIDEGNLIPLIDTSAFGEDMFEGLEEINGEKFIPVYNLGKLKQFAEKIADKIVEVSDFAKSYVSQSKKSEATYINLYAKDEDFSPRIKIRLATHKPIHYESISTFYYDLNKTLKENMVELNNLIKGKEFGQVSTGREQQAMVDALYGTDRGVWGNAFSFEGLEDNWFGQSAKAREERRSFVKGAFDPLIKAIEITEHADYSTLSHEFSHYWIDSIWGHIESGNASKEY